VTPAAPEATATPADPSEAELAVEIAREAGALALSRFRNPDLSVDLKADGSPVTAADRDAETLVRGRLGAAFADDAILGEEHGTVSGISGRTWIIDPIDGTKAFTQGVPLWSTLVSLVDEEGPLIGVIDLPALGETVWAGRGLGAFCNGEPCSVSERSSIDGAYLMTSGTDYWPPGALAAVIASPLHVRTWGDAYGYALVATGRAEAMVDPEAFAWDVAGVSLIVAEAGGTFSSFAGSGGPHAWQSGSGFASNGLLHDAVLGLWEGLGC